MVNVDVGVTRRMVGWAETSGWLWSVDSKQHKGVIGGGIVGWHKPQRTDIIYRDNEEWFRNNVRVRKTHISSGAKIHGI